jgi:hypothetical protein
MIGGRDFESLVADIGTHGLKVEIMLCDDKILDGRNRYRACQKAGVDPRFTRYEGDDPLSYVLSLNLRRRHLDASQRAMIAAKAADIRKLERLRNPATLPVLTQPEIADQMQVSEGSVRTAKKVLDHGTPELIKKVEQGEISVFKAADTIQNKPTVTGPPPWTTIDGAPGYSWLMDEIAAGEDHLVYAAQIMLNLKPKMSESERNKGKNAFLDIATRASRCAAILKPEGNSK